MKFFLFSKGSSDWSHSSFPWLEFGRLWAFSVSFLIKKSTSSFRYQPKIIYLIFIWFLAKQDLMIWIILMCYSTLNYIAIRLYHFAVRHITLLDIFIQYNNTFCCCILIGMFFNHCNTPFYPQQL